MKTNFTISFLGLAFLLISLGCKKEEVPPIEISPPDLTITNPNKEVALQINGTRPALDTTTQTFLFPLASNTENLNPLIEVDNQPSSILIDNQNVNNYEINELMLANDNTPHSLSLNYEGNLSENYQLVFTNLPIIQIFTYGAMIEDEPKILADFIINDPNYFINGQAEQKLTANIGIEIRGLSSQKYDKKAFGIEFWEDQIGAKKLDVSLLGMRKDDDWILDAMFIDPARMRNRVSTDIWLDFQQVPYIDYEPYAKNGTNGQLVEIFINQEYRGIYTLTERIDRKLLKLKDFKETSNFGLLYKAIGWGDPVTFTGYEEYDPNLYHWKGWEQKYPDPMDEGIFWEPMADFVKFVVESPDAQFKTNIGQQLNIKNAVDYFIFLNLIRADDNVGKNTFLAKYQQTDPFFFVPWDLDATWGLSWSGNHTSPNGILSNGLFDRLLATNTDNFKGRVKERWSNARQGIFTKEHLLNYFQDYNSLLNQRNAFSREQEKWAISNDLSLEMTRINQWIDNRLLFLDEYFEKL